MTSCRDVTKDSFPVAKSSRNVVTNVFMPWRGGINFASLQCLFRAFLKKNKISMTSFKVSTFFPGCEKVSSATE